MPIIRNAQSDNLGKWGNDILMYGERGKKSLRTTGIKYIGRCNNYYGTEVVIFKKQK